MKRAIIAAVLVIAAMLAGCSTLGGMVKPADLPVSAELSEPAKIAQTAINEANVILIAAADVTYQYVVEGWISKEEGRSYYVVLRDWEQKLIAAQKLLDAGKALDAQSEAELIRKAIVALHKEILKRKSA